MKPFVAGTFLFALSLPLLAQEPLGAPKTPKVVQEHWQTASIDGLRSGYVQFTVQEMEAPAVGKFFRATKKLALTLRRFGDVAHIEAVTGTDEMPDGTVLGAFMKQGLGKNVDLTVQGVVRNGVLVTSADGRMKFDQKEVPWSPKVIGALGEMNYVKKTKPQPGTQFEFLIYEPIINSMVKVHGKAEAYEEVAIAGIKPRLLRVTERPDVLKIKQGDGSTQDFQLPGSTFWYDANYEQVKSETIMPGIGKLVLERATREAAIQPCVGPDLGWRQAIKLNQQLARPHDAAEVIYRITLKDGDPATVFARDERQSVRSAKDGVVELVVRPVRQPPAADAKSPPPSPEFFSNNSFINSDDPIVKQHAAAAVGNATDPWEKAKLIERWVHSNMKAMNFTEAMSPASEVARSLHGDCTEFSMLAAAMCRAAGVPSRTALGLVYADPREGRPPMLAMHMWIEVCVRGQWVGLDATLGRGSIGPAHIKVADHSWHQVATMTPLMPLMRVTMGEAAVEIVLEQAVRVDSEKR